MKKIKLIITIILSLILLVFQFETAQAETVPSGEPTIVDKKEYSGSILLRYISTCTPNADSKITDIINHSSNPLPQVWCDKISKSLSDVKKTTTNGQTVCTGTMSTYKKLNLTTKNYESISINKGYGLLYAIYGGDATNNIFSERAIIYPKNLKTASRIYIHWHGKGWEAYQPPNECTNKSAFCKLSTNMNDSVILWPRTFNVGATVQKLSTDELKCFFDEALKIINTEGIDTKNSNIVITGHSAGGNWVTKSLTNTSWAGGKKILAGIFFDATYGWESTLFGSGYNPAPIFTYYNLPDGGAPEGPFARALKTKKPEMVKILGLKGINHQDVLTYCFMDHITGTGCSGPGSEIPSPFTNSFETIDGAPTITQSNIPQSQTIDLTSELDTLVKTPQLQIKIPGLNITDGVSFIQRDGNIYLQSTMFQQYLVAVYKYSVVAISVLAVIMIMVAGIQWLVSGGSPDKINAAKKRIGGATIGIILAVGSYTILYTINPYLVKFTSLETIYIPREGAEEELPSSFYPTVNVSLAPGTPIDPKDSVFPLTKSSFYKNSDNFGQPRTHKDKKSGIISLRCHGGVDIYTQPPGTVVAMDDGEVLYIDTAYMRDSKGCKGTEAENGAKWANSEELLKKGQVGSMLIYHPNLGITAYYGEINQPDIIAFIERNKPNGAKDGKFYRNITNVTVKKGQILGTASRCGMLHFELYAGKKSSYSFWNPQPPQATVKQTYETRNYCKKPEIMNLGGYPENLIDANLLLPNMKSYLQ